MTSDHQFQMQYDKLFDLFTQHSEKYYTEAEGVFRKFNKEWNADFLRFKPDLLRFEIDMFFLFELSSSMLSAKLDKSVWSEILHLFQDRLIQHFTGKISIVDTFEDIIRARVEGYGRVKNSYGGTHDFAGLYIDLLRELLQNIYASNSRGEIAVRNPVVIDGFFEKTEFECRMRPIHMSTSEEFSCCLKHLFKANSDIRSLSSEEIDRLIERGKREAEKILSEVDWEQISGSFSAFIRKQLQDKTLSEADLSKMSGSKFIRGIIDKQKKRNL